MPIYEYICRGCGSTFEKLVRMSNANDGVECPGCGDSGMRKLSVFAAFSKGSDGVPVASIGGGGGCASCGGGHCASCGGH